MNATTRVALIGLIAAGSSGVPRYAQQMSRALARAAPSFPDLDLVLVTTAAGRDRVGPLDMEIATFGNRLRSINEGPARVLSEQMAARRSDADLLHFFDFSGPILAPARPFTLTAHDVASVNVASAYSSIQNGVRQRLLPWAAARARLIVAVSEFARTEVMRHLGVDSHRITVIPSGPGMLGDAGSLPPTDDPPEAPFLLYVGNFAANKNLPVLIRAFDLSGSDVRLKLVGRPRRGASETMEAISAASASAQSRISVVSAASDADVDRFYRSALALVLPSRYEGFGFTPLEAMARGCPVVASDLPAIREVSGHAALLVPPGDERAWATAIGRIVTEPRLRRDLCARGRALVTRYSWERSAETLCTSLLAAAGSR